MEQFDQLLTCPICLDRYRNPKLLPCQHSFCMEPCLEGLIDYVRREVKCPECRAEHRIPYNGIQGYPNNVTLQRFLELHIEITGELPDPTANMIMERCGICSEKAYCNVCCHCDKKICGDCKRNHLEILRREIARINNQIRRSMQRLRDGLELTDKSIIVLQQNALAASEEIEDVSVRLQKTIEERTNQLKMEMEQFVSSESKALKATRDNIEQELSNIESNCELAEKYMRADDSRCDWDDRELMDAKDVYLRTMEFLRNFEVVDTSAASEQHSRRLRFHMNPDCNSLAHSLSRFGELLCHSSCAQTPSGIVRSKSDHRLATYKQQEDRAYISYSDLDVSAPQRRTFGERIGSRDRYGLDRSCGSDLDYDMSEARIRNRFRSRFGRNLEVPDVDQVDSFSTRKHSDVHPAPAKQALKPRALDTEDVSRGPLSGVGRLLDSPRVMEKIQEGQQEAKKKEKLQLQPTAANLVAPVAKKAGKLVKDDDKSKIVKRQVRSIKAGEDKEARPLLERMDTLKKEEPKPKDRRKGNKMNSPKASQPNSPVAFKPKDELTFRKSITEQKNDAEDASRSKKKKSIPSKTFLRKNSNSAEASSDDDIITDNSPSTSTPVEKQQLKKSLCFSTPRTSFDDVKNTSTSEDSTFESSPQTPLGNDTSALPVISKNVGRKSSAATKNEDVPPSPSTSRCKDASPGLSCVDSGRQKIRFQTRIINRPATPNSKELKAEPSQSETTESDETESEEMEDADQQLEIQTNAKSDERVLGSILSKPSMKTANHSSQNAASSFQEESGCFGRSRTVPNLYSQHSASKSYTSPPSYSNSRNNLYNPRDFTQNYNLGRDMSGTYQKQAATSNGTTSRNSNISSQLHKRPNYTVTYGPDMDSDRYSVGRYLNRHRGSVGDSEDSNRPYSSKFLNRSKSSAAIIDAEDRIIRNKEDCRQPSSKSKYGHNLQERRTRFSRSKSSGDVLNNDDEDQDMSSRRESLEDQNEGKDSVTSWANYLKNKYGNRSTINRSKSSTSIRFSSLELSSESSDNETPIISTARTQYLSKKKMLFKFGGRGSEKGHFTWPRGITIDSKGNIVVADSSNHRIQIFTPDGCFMKEFGTYGTGEGEFDCLAGVTVNRIGQFIIADRYNHRIQVFDPSGRFLRAFGSQGSTDGRFNYPWGLASDNLGFIYVCDKENHRIQVFQSDGTFVGKFGSFGSKPGQLEHPHYISIGNNNRVVVSDSSNHRVQIFDVNGQLLFTLGKEGSDEGQFKFPRGIAVDEKGYIIVGDSGNNRIQIFSPEGQFLRCFGTWGSADGEFKGLEGVAVNSSGNIFVCDRENHRIQMF